MRVSFDSSIWRQKQGTPGRKQMVNWQFDYAGMRCVIPAVYRFPRGIVFDILCFVDEGRLKDYFAQYQHLEEKLTAAQRRSAEQENPFQPVPLREIWLNGVQMAEGITYSHAATIPWANPQEELERLRQAYPAWLGGTEPFACQRVLVHYSATERWLERLLRRLRLNRIRNMGLVTQATTRLIPLELHFELLAGETCKQVAFTHPLTGQSHRLHFGKAMAQEFPFGRQGSCTLHALLAEYEVEPALPEGCAIDFQSSMSFRQPDVERLRIMEEEPDYRQASAIGIIGGACGPTAIFVGSSHKNAQPVGPHGLPLHTCFSVPGFQKMERWPFAIEGIVAPGLRQQRFEFGGG